MSSKRRNNFNTFAEKDLNYNLLGSICSVFKIITHFFDAFT